MINLSEDELEKGRKELKKIYDLLEKNLLFREEANINCEEMRVLKNLSEGKIVLDDGEIICLKNLFFITNLLADSNG